MKLLTSCFALIALISAISAFAQEESPSPSPSEQENASATVETSPEATKSPAASEAAPAASPTAESRVKTSGVAAPSSKKSDADTGSKKSAAEPTAKSAKKMSPEATVKDNENKWEAAVASHDIATIEGMIASDFIGVSEKGKFVNKAGLVSESKKDKDSYQSAKVEKLNVHVVDKDLVVVTGSAREKGTGKDGQGFDRTYLFTDTWTDRNGQWQCVASQVSLRSGK